MRIRQMWTRHNLNNNHKYLIPDTLYYDITHKVYVSQKIGPVHIKNQHK